MDAALKLDKAGEQQSPKKTSTRIVLVVLNRNVGKI